MTDRSMRATSILLLSAALLLISGCATTGDDGSPSLFVLEDGPSAPDKTSTPGAPSLAIAPVAVASYLDQGGIVYQTEVHRIVVANNNRWAAPLTDQLTDTLYGVLASELPGVNLSRPANAQNASYRLRTYIDSFFGHYGGNAVVAGRWTLIGPQGATVASRTFKRRTPLPRDGYPALVSSLSQGWQTVGDSIASNVGSALEQRATQH
ncbi:ABC-type transport auxiliary lipoprotein family protein [Salinisphaera sp. SPP-AMP-43]|uniref:PqiC family protein n=1 Tax=Salinisphaera sp. SPP-AMP-43 TaxID=3121288 RepID=UPI003C6E1ABF